MENSRAGFRWVDGGPPLSCARVTPGKLTCPRTSAASKTLSSGFTRVNRERGRISHCALLYRTRKRTEYQVPGTYQDGGGLLTVFRSIFSYSTTTTTTPFPSDPGSENTICSLHGNFFHDNEYQEFTAWCPQGIMEKNFSLFIIIIIISFLLYLRPRGWRTDAHYSEHFMAVRKIARSRYPRNVDKWFRTIIIMIISFAGI